MNASILDLGRFTRRGAAAQAEVDRAIARADLVNLVKHAHDELVAAKIRFTAAQRTLADFDEAGRARR